MCTAKKNPKHQRRTPHFYKQKYAFLENITKLPTPFNISPYLQAIKITNSPLQQWLVVHLYMPSHQDDLALIPEIYNDITNLTQNHPNHTQILTRDFNRAIVLIGR